MTAKLLSFDTPKLTLVGFSDKGAFVTIGSVPLEDPTTRYTMIDEILGHVESCAASDTMCRIGNTTFFPTAFDFFMVQ